MFAARRILLYFGKHVVSLQIGAYLILEVGKVFGVDLGLLTALVDFTRYSLDVNMETLIFFITVMNRYRTKLRLVRHLVKEICFLYLVHV